MRRYHVSYDMAVEIIYRYLERIYQLNKHKGTNVVKVEQLFDLNIELKGLVDQLRHDEHDIDRIIADKKATLNMKYLYDTIEIHIDGAARGNEDREKDNVSGLAFSISADGQIIHEQCICLGARVRLAKLRNEPYSIQTDIVPATNNVAEYMALIHVLEYLLNNELTANHIKIFSDSEVVVYQVNKINSTRSSHLIRLRNCVWELLGEFNNISISHIPREENDHVDWMLCLFLDSLQGIKRDPATRRVIKDQDDTNSV